MRKMLLIVDIVMQQHVRQCDMHFFFCLYVAGGPSRWWHHADMFALHMQLMWPLAMLQQRQKKHVNINDNKPDGNRQFAHTQIDIWPTESER